MAATRTYLFPESGKIAENIKNDAFLRYRLETVKSVGDELKKTPASQLKYSEFKIFYETGSRQEYELSYFAHRKRLNTFALLALIYGGEYVSCLEDAIWAVLDEYTWALPAHISRDENVSERITHIDLFASETGFTLAEILRLTGGMLSPEVTERAELEIRRRIIEPYLSGRENSWDKIENNWSAVCAGSVGAAFLYLAEDAEINCALPRILKTLECYLAGFGFDGASVEGMNYWHYGFGYFVYFASLLKDYNGTDLFDNEKVKNIALFQQKMRLKNNKTPSFSDGSGTFDHISGLTHFLKTRYDEIIIPDDSCAQSVYGDACFRFAPFIRNFAWRNTAFETKSAPESGCSYFEDAAWYIKTAGKYDFAAKAGMNDESHNHVDIGAFLINADGKSIISDPGRGEYTAGYFGPERYTYFAPSAHAHSIPVINGRIQCAGREFYGRVLKADDKTLSMELAPAYDDEKLKSLVRSFEFLENGVRINDSFSFSGDGNAVTEHFVTEVRPEAADGGVRLGGAFLKTDAAPEFKEITFETGHGKKTVWTVDFVFENLGSDAELSFLVSEEAEK